MAEGKYGRLFTEQDVRELMATFGRHIAELAVDVQRGRATAPSGGVTLDLISELIASAEMTFPADEPLFLLRAQDKITPGVVASYVGGTYAHGCSEEHRRSAEEAFNRIHGWQLEHSDRVKVPD